MRKPHLPQLGFALLDMVIAIVVATVLAAIAVPKIGAFAAIGQSASADRIASTISQARAAAMAAGSATRVAIDANGASACWGAPCAASGSNANPLLGRDGAPLFASSGGAAITGAPAFIDFDPSGLPSASGSFSVGSALVAIDPTLGTVSRPGAGG